jgi:uncharacterized protein with PIN domain
MSACHENRRQYGGRGEGHLLLCDEMLHRVGRWLRAAGYDTALAGRGSDDTQLLALAENEARLLLTRDRHLAERAGEQALLLVSEGVEANARELSRRLRIDWISAAFTRCMVDNAVLRLASEDERRLAPQRARELDGPISVCPECRRVFWPGSHTRRMQARLSAWQVRGDA